MSKHLIMKYNDGNNNYPKIGLSIGYPADFSAAVGFDNDVHPVCVQRSAFCDTDTTRLPSRFTADEGWVMRDGVQATDLISNAPVEPLPRVQFSSTVDETYTLYDASVVATICGMFVVVFMFGVFVGRATTSFVSGAEKSKSQLDENLNYRLIA